jgi:hypothetical protein
MWETMGVSASSCGELLRVQVVEFARVGPAGARGGLRNYRETRR